MTTLNTKNQITIKQSALYILDDPLDRAVLRLLENKIVKDNGEQYTRNELINIYNNIETTFKARGRGGSYTFTIKTEIEKQLLEKLNEVSLDYMDLLGTGFSEEGYSKSMETYLWDKWREINDLEINRGEE